MAIDMTEPRSPGWWLSKLLKDLGERQDRYDLLDSYYRGDPPLPQGPESSREAFRRFQATARTNFASLVVEAVRERMLVAGFRSGAGGDENGDAEAWRIWQANQLDADSALVHRASLALSDAYVIVGPPEEGVPVITPEDPRQVVTAHDPVRHRRVVAALKVFADDVDDVDSAYLYLPGQVWRAVRRRQPAAGVVPSSDLSGWDWLEDGPGRLPAGVVPVVRFPNRADLAGNSMGEFEDSVDVLDRINFMLLQRMMIAAVQAFRQRAVKGLPRHDENGDEIDYTGMFPMDPGALWQLPDDGEIWESQQVDLGPILNSVRHDVQDLAAVTRTPLFYLTPDATDGSAEGASLAREGLIFKTRDRLSQAGESWEQVMALAFLFAGDQQRASAVDMETIWLPPERHSLAERYDAATKANSVGVPWRSIMTDVLQFSPQQVARMEAERLIDQLFTPANPFAEQQQEEEEPQEEEQGAGTA